MTKFTDFNPESLKGATLSYVSLGMYDILLHFYPNKIKVNIENWELIGKDGKLVDYSQSNKNREAYFLHCIIGAQVKHCDKTSTYNIYFDNDLTLKVYCSNTDYQNSSLAVAVLNEGFPYG